MSTVERHRYMVPSTYGKRAGNNSTEAAAPSSESRITYGDAERKANMGGLLRMDDVILETVVTHTTHTRTRTVFPPLALRSVPSLPRLPSSNVYAPEKYPLAQNDMPDHLLSYPIRIGDYTAVVREWYVDDELEEEIHASQTCGNGWTKLSPDNDAEHRASFERITPEEALDALQSLQKDQDHSMASLADKEDVDPSLAREGKKRARQTKRPSSTEPNSSDSEPETGDIQGHLGPPRKRGRLQGQASDESLRMPLMPGSLPLDGFRSIPGSLSVDELAPRPPPNDSSADPAVTSLAALTSLPDLASSFDQLPDNLQQHVLIQMLRRIRQPSLQVIADFILPATQRDFIGRLPREVACQIVSNLSKADAAAAAQVSKTWQSIVDGDRGVWKANMIKDGLWVGHKDEESEEAKIEERWRLAEEFAGRTSPRLFPSPPKQPSDHPLSNPLAIKELYRQRFVTRKAWLTPQLENHVTFTGVGTNVIACLQFDDDRIVASSEDHSVNVYDMYDGHVIARLDGHEGGVWALQYRGDVLVTGSTDRTVRVWDLDTHKQMHVFLGHTSTVRCMQIVEPVLDEATGKYQPPYPIFVTGSRDHTLRVWKLPRKGEAAHIGGVKMSRKTMILPKDNPFHLHLLEGHTEPVRAIAAHGRFCVSGSYDHTVRVWDLVNGTCLHVLKGHGAKVYSVALDTIRGRCVSGDADGVIMVWDIKTGQRIHTMLGHTNLVGLMAVSPNMIVSAAADSTIRTWDADSGAACQVLASHTGAITCFQHDETKIVSGSEDGLKVWDLKTGQCVRELLTGVNNVWQVRFKNNTCVAASNRNGATMFDVFRFKCLNSETTPSQMTAENSNWDVETRQPWEREDPLQSPIPEQPTTPIPPNRQKGRLIMPPKASRGSTIRLSPQDPNPDRAADDRGRAFLFPPEGTPQQGSKS